MSASASSQLPADGLFLAADEIGINARFIYQLFVLAMLHNAPVIDDQNLICMAHGFQPVGDHDDGLIPSECLDSFLQSVLILGVDVCRCLVQNDDMCVLQHGTRNGNALFFTAGNAGAAIADDRIVTIRQSLDEVVTASLFWCRDHFVVRGVRSAEFDIVFDGIGKEVNILEHHTDLIHKRFQGVILHVISADFDAAAFGIPKAGNEITEGGLAAVGGTDDRRCHLIRQRDGNVV